MAIILYFLWELGMCSAVVKLVEMKNSSSEGDSSLLNRFSSRQSSEIVIAFAGPVGSGVGSVINSASRSLKQLNYQVEVIKLSEFLEESIREKLVSSLTKVAGQSIRFHRYRNLQEAGRLMREKTENRHLLAEYAVKKIVFDRELRTPSSSAGGIPDLSNNKVAYLIDQVKRPEEVELLRALYRNLFYLIGITKPFDQRVRLLEDEGVDEEEVKVLMEIDRNESLEGGQQLDKTLHLADFFVRNDSSVDKRNNIERFIKLIHGDKSQTPDHRENGMYAAYAAGMRSACLSRQVGAAITNSNGEVISTGCNDVPSPFGGLYSGGEGVLDARCLHTKENHCFNDYYKKELQSNIGNVLQEELGRKDVGEDGAITFNGIQLSPEKREKILNSIYSKTRLGSLIEFSRSVHAEMDAIVALARGAGGVKGSVLYSTTFPCHSCARHIVAAGIEEIYYIEPYEKSMARDLHADAIAFEIPSDDEVKVQGVSRRRVKFLHFEGVAPRIFATVFKASERKDKKSGKFVPFMMENAKKILPEYLDNYRDFEVAAVAHFSNGLDLIKKNSV